MSNDPKKKPLSKRDQILARAKSSGSGGKGAAFAQSSAREIDGDLLRLLTSSTKSSKRPADENRSYVSTKGRTYAKRNEGAQTDISVVKVTDFSQVTSPTLQEDGDRVLSLKDSLPKTFGGNNKTKTGARYFTPGAVALSPPAGNKSPSTSDYQTPLVTNKDVLKGRELQRRQKGAPKVVSEPSFAVKEKVSSPFAKASFSIENAEPSDLPGKKIPSLHDISHSSSGFEYVSKDNKYCRRENAAFRKEQADNDKTTMYTTSDVSKIFLHKDDEQHMQNINARLVTQSAFVPSTITTDEQQHPYNNEMQMKPSSTNIPYHFEEENSTHIAVPHEQQSASNYDRQNFVQARPVIMGTLHENRNSDDLIIATSVERNDDVPQVTGIVVDAVVVNKVPAQATPCYQDRRMILICVLLSITAVAVAVAVTVTILLSLSKGNASESIEEFPPSTNAPSLSPYTSSLNVLQELYYSTSGPNWKVTWDFSSGQSYCSFYGITCDDLDEIAEIDLSENDLQGSLPPEIGLLPSLKTLILHTNAITGEIPSELGKLSSLTTLSLWSNSITGTVPFQLGTLSSLTSLDLDSNSMTGTIPSELGMLSSLFDLWMRGNSITGTIPSELGMISSLVWLYLDENSISGTIPSEIGMLSSLERLYLTFNSITGTIPSEIGMLSSLEFLDLDFNSFTGTIPSEVGMLYSLEWLDLDFNSFTGTIPSEIGMLSSLEWLDLDFNAITGTIPSEIGMLYSLEWLDLDNNSITGTLPTELCTLSNTTIYYDEFEIFCICVGNSYDEGTSCN